MAYARWIFRGSLVDAYGMALPPVVQAAYGSRVGVELFGITLFNNGHVMQMLEGEVAVLQKAMHDLRDLSKLFGIERLLEETIDEPATRDVAVGLNRFVDEISEHLPPHVKVFTICADEVCGRTVPGAARNMLLGFI